MKAMVLAAGLGTRLRPLTNDRPKALVELSGRPLLEIALTRLKSFGIQEVIVNVHHFADMVVEYLRVYDNFGMQIEISREDLLLDTGGGLKKAAWFLGDSDPFIVHNVDILSTLDLHQLVRFHTEHGALATLAVKHRDTSRYLLFNEQGELCGRRSKPELKDEIVRPSRQVIPLAFSGIHVASPRLFPLMTEEGVFSIIPAYLRLAGQGEKILAYRSDDDEWMDLGRPENLKQRS